MGRPKVGSFGAPMPRELNLPVAEGSRGMGALVSPPGRADPQETTLGALLDQPARPGGQSFGLSFILNHMTYFTSLINQTPDRLVNSTAHGLILNGVFFTL